MMTQFFQDMVDEEKRCVLVPHPNSLYLEQVVGEEKAAEVFNTYPDDQNPLKSGRVYRSMLRDQYLTMARIRAGRS